MGQVAPNPHSESIADNFRVVVVLHLLISFVHLLCGQKYAVGHILWASLGYFAVRDKIEGYMVWVVILYSQFSAIQVLGGYFYSKPYFLSPEANTFSVPGLSPVRHAVELQLIAMHAILAILSYNLFRSLVEQELNLQNRRAEVERNTAQEARSGYQAEDRGGDGDCPAVQDIELNSVRS
ncbi:hypothetical protein AAMO2058_000534600 [Amorphochlora amoebiformis]